MIPKYCLRVTRWCKKENSQNEQWNPALVNYWGNDMVHISNRQKANGQKKEVAIF